MKYRIIEEFRYGHPTFYIQYWHVGYEEWTAVMTYALDSLESAKLALKLFQDNTEKLTEYKPRIIHEVE